MTYKSTYTFIKQYSTIQMIMQFIFSTMPLNKFNEHKFNNENE